VAAAKRLTGGKGVSVVANCVGGQWSATAFEQSQDMLAPGGLLHQIGLSGNIALPFHPSKMMERRLVGGYTPDVDQEEMAGVAMAALAAGEVRVAPLITHQFPGRDAKQAYDLLHDHPDQALGVLLQWNDL
jgi:threonine dehydrogenase-like Zn-dependent dehydrogenase